MEWCKALIMSAALLRHPEMGMVNGGEFDPRDRLGYIYNYLQCLVALGRAVPKPNCGAIRQYVFL